MGAQNVATQVKAIMEEARKQLVNSQEYQKRYYCKVMADTYNLYYQPTAMDCTPKSSGGHLGIYIYIPLWMAYALQLGSCSTVPLLCGG